ncbi:Eburicol 14-alpha-demethylase [Cryoendolithus antarcticus]|uniref:Eburicol 14-alpha-demethylase n=1 Tax=Cryoendolithus antarcticus TaxID=1507870 RepID=A0A1V8T8H6_9PEZI|nr:Eburicol 14-alpha-demethylase [Cryoendolithus antarcticus]
MGLLQTLAGPLAPHIDSLPTWLVIVTALASLLTLTIIINVANQILTRRSDEPPVVFHLLPWIGSTVTYGIDPYAFFFKCRAKYGDVFTFVLLGKKTTVCLGTKGNDFILNAKLKDVNAEEIYHPLTTPVFGKDVVYDCPNSKLMEQKKFVKFGLTTSAFRSYVTLIAEETRQFFSRDAPSKRFASTSGTVNLPPTLAELTIYTASRSLQGKEVRERFDSGFADLYHDLDGGFVPINFKLGWMPLPHNRRRDRAQKKMAQTYMDIMTERRKEGNLEKEEDMIWNLMNCEYKNGTPVPDKEVAHMMIALLMAGQHSSSATITWILLRLATRPEIQDELLEEQRQVLGTKADGSIADMTYEDLARLPLHNSVVKETLRLHTPIHSVMRVVKNPLPVEGTPYTIPTSHVLLASPGVTSRVAEHFPDPMLWEPHRWDETPAEKHAHLAPSHVKEGVVEEKEDYGYGLISKGAASPYLPFGAGRHRCIGEQFAYLQLQTILATVVRDLRFKNVEGVEGVVGTDYSSLFSRPLNPAIVRWERREKK